MKIYMVKEGKLEEKKDLVFSSGDAYIIDNGSKIWIWLGKDCSVDEKGVAAAEARRLDEERGGEAKIITVDQGEEVAEFLTLVNGVKIIDANLAKSMLKDVSTGSFAGHMEHVNALYRVSSEEFDGIDAMKFVQVPFERSSLDSEDVFIADLGDEIWIWQGKDCNVKEKVKARQFASKFDAERAGAQKIRIFEEGDDEEFLAIFEGKVPEIKSHDIKLEKAEVKEEKAETPAEKEAEKEAPKMSEEPKKEEKKEEEEPAAPKRAPPMPSHEPGEILVQHGSGRLKCPKCGNVNPNMIREVPDKTRIIMDYPRLYGKKYICGVCGTHWRREY